jgi:hypothetical protein
MVSTPCRKPLKRLGPLYHIYTPLKQGVNEKNPLTMEMFVKASSYIDGKL